MAFDPTILAQIQMWGGTPPTTVVLQKFQLRCDSCKQYMSQLETKLEFAGMSTHLTAKCLSKFSEKHLVNVDLHKSNQQIITGEVNV